MFFLVKMDSSSLPGTSRNEDCNFMSMVDIIKLLYYTGLTSVALWKDVLNKIKGSVLEENDLEIFNLYIRLVDISKKIQECLEITFANHSQKHLDSVETYLFDIDEIYEFLSINTLNFFEKNVQKSVYNALVSHIKSYLVKINNDVDDDNEIEIDDLDSEDENGEFEKLFRSIGTKEKKENTFQQSVMFQSNETRKTITTPGEKGGYLIKIEITDTKDLKGVNKSEWWTKAAYKSTFLINSSKDPRLIQLQKIILNVAKELATVKNVKKQKFKKFN